MEFNIVNPIIEEYINQNMKPESDLLKALTEETYKKMSEPQMLCGPVVGRLLKLLVSLSMAKIVLEIGTFTGYSALCMADALPQDGKLMTCEIDLKAIEFAQKYFDKTYLGQKITILPGLALDSIKDIQETLDFVFVDADKSNYLNYYKAVFPKVKSGGLIVFDNALRKGQVHNPKDHDVKSIVETNKYIAHDKNVDNILLSIRDGVNIVRKL